MKKGRHPPAFLRYIGSGLQAETLWQDAGRFMLGIQWGSIWETKIYDPMAAKETNLKLTPGRLRSVETTKNPETVTWMGARQGLGLAKGNGVGVDGSFGTKRDGVSGHGAARFACFLCRKGTQLGFVESIGTRRVEHTIFGKTQILCALLYWPRRCQKKNRASRSFLTLSENKNRTSRGFLVALSTKN